MRLRMLGLTVLAFCFVGADDKSAPKDDGASEEMGAETSTETLAKEKLTLAKLQGYIGDWRGVGQPQRGSNKGAWSEEAGWAWDFSGERAAIGFEVKDGKYYSAGKLRAGVEEGTFELVAVRADGKTEDKFSGSLDDEGQLVLVDEKAAADRPARISIRQVADGDRMLILLERKIPSSDRHTRMAEIGFTRKGVMFAKGATGPECVVTGGLGTIEVEHEGKKYYVCCTGCRDHFAQDPEGVLADYRERKAKEKEEEQAKREAEKGEKK